MLMFEELSLLNIETSVHIHRLMIYYTTKCHVQMSVNDVMIFILHHTIIQAAFVCVFVCLFPISSEVL